MDFDSQTILLVEDNHADVFIFKRLAEKAGMRNPVQVVRTGREAVDYLAGAGEYVNRQQFPLPILVVLDINLPFRSGLEVLKWIREKPVISKLDVITLTSSSERRDVARARELGALSYLVKPPTVEVLQQVMRLLRMRQMQPEYWPQVSGCMFSSSEILPALPRVAGRR